MSAPTYRVERTYRNFVSGECRSEVLPRIYKSIYAAERRAQASRWTTMPNRYTRVDSMDARVLTVEGGAQ